MRKNRTRETWGLLERFLREADEDRPRTMYSGRRMKYTELQKLSYLYGNGRMPAAEGGVCRVTEPADWDGERFGPWDPAPIVRSVNNRWDIERVWDNWSPDEHVAIQDAVGSTKGFDAQAGTVPMMASKKALGFKHGPGQKPGDKGEPNRPYEPHKIRGSGDSEKSDVGSSVDQGFVLPANNPNPNSSKRLYKPDPHATSPARPYSGPGTGRDVTAAPARSSDWYDVIVMAEVSGPASAGKAGRLLDADRVLPKRLVWLPMSRSVTGGSGVGRDSVATSASDQEMALMDLLHGSVSVQPRNQQRRRSPEPGAGEKAPIRPDRAARAAKLEPELDDGEEEEG